MKDFEAWLGNIVPKEKELPSGLRKVDWGTFKATFKATCRSCGRDYVLYCAPEEFFEENNYCGGSDRCIP